MAKLCIIIFLSLFALAQNAKILSIFSLPSRSHYILGDILCRRLAEKGHQITMVSPFPKSKPIPNWTDIDLVGFQEDMTRREQFIMEFGKQSIISGLPSLFNMTRHYAFETLKNSEIQKLIKSEAKFDLILLDVFLVDSHFVFGHLFKAPIVALAAFGTNPFVNYIVGNHAPYSYVPNKYQPLTDNMRFFERVKNTIMLLIGEGLLRYNSRLHETFIREHFPGSPSLDDLTNDVALLLSNSHYSLEYPKPSVPNVVEIGGFHVEPAKKLPADLQKYLDGAKEGVVYFSLGSNLKSSNLPQNKVAEILRTFSKIPLKVLWKWETDSLLGKPDNVKLGKWFSQNDILAHPNVKVFITHGGMLSTIETVYHGVPLIGIPFYGDQKSNVMLTTGLGYGYQLLLDDLTEATLTHALNEIVNNTKYQENIKKRSALLKDQPIKPLDNAVFWIEHVLRHNGGAHLRTKMNRLSLYQYLLLDVVLFIILAVFLIDFVIYFVIKKLLGLLKSSPTKPKPSQNKPKSSQNKVKSSKAKQN